MVEGQLKGMMEEANKDNTLKKVVEACLNKKTLELNAMECQAITIKRARELVEHKVKGIAGKTQRGRNHACRSF